MGRKTERQANQSKEWLVQSLLSLLSEQDFHTIKISRIAENAGLDRRTFYRHFKTKEDIIRYYIRSLSREFDQSFQRVEAMSTKRIAEEFFLIFARNKEIALMLHRHKLLPLLLYELNEIFPEYHYKYHTGEAVYHPDAESYSLAYHVGGFFNLLLQWLEAGMDKTPQELALIISRFLPERI